jgi:hypothetical protein
VADAPCPVPAAPRPALPGTRALGASAARDSVTELHFDDLESMGRNFADPYARDVVGPDAVNFSDQPAALSLLVEESEAEAPPPGGGTVKVLHFLKAADGIAPAAFQKRLRRAYEDMLADPSGPARYLRGHEWNTALPAHPPGRDLRRPGRRRHRAA